MYENINLDDIAEKIFQIIKGYNLNPLNFGIAMTLKKDEFDHLAIECPASYLHPQHKPGLIVKTKTEIDGTQWDIQIMKEFSQKIALTIKINEPLITVAKENKKKGFTKRRILVDQSVGYVKTLF